MASSISPGTYAALSAAAYGTHPTPTGWTVIDKQEIDNDGFKAVAYENTTTGQIVIAYAGTVPDFSPYGLGTLNADVAIGLGNDPKAFNDAQAFAEQVINNDVPQGYAVSVTGHSLGGAEAEWVASQTSGLAGETFGAPGIANPGPYGQGLINYQNYGDIVPSVWRPAGWH